MQPELQTDFQMITNQQGNTAIGSQGSSLKENNELKGEAECFLGMLNDINKIPSENLLDAKKLQEKSQRNENMLGMVVNTEQEIGSLINDMTLKREKLAELLLEFEQNTKGNEEKQLSSKSDGKDLLKGQISGNEKDFRLFEFPGKTETGNNPIDKNTIVTASKAESDSDAKKSVLSEMLNDLVKTKENETKAWQGELNKNNAGIQISKGFKGNDGKEVKAQLLNGIEADITKTIKDLETKDKKEDGHIKLVADIKDVKKVSAAERILMESTTFKPDMEESKKINRTQLFDDEIKDSDSSKKEHLLKISESFKEKDQESDLLKRDNSSDKKASQSEKEFINLKEVGLKIKAAGSEFSAGKMHSMESESKDNGIILPKNVSGDKSFEEIMLGRESRESSSISRAGTLNQIVEKAAFSLKNGKTQARVELKPEFLGSVRMQITTENHLVRVRILTELPVVKEMIENNISQLKMDLQSHGLAIDKIDVSVANDSQQHGKGFEETELLSEKENSDVSDKKAVVEEETETANLLKESTAEYGLDFFA